MPMGNDFWSGAFPGLILATTMSVGLLRLVDRPALRHIVWLVPAAHLAGAFVVGPALALTYGAWTRWLPGQAATWAWVAGWALVGVLAAQLSTRASGARHGWCATIAFMSSAMVGILIPVFYQLIAA